MSYTLYHPLGLNFFFLDLCFFFSYSLLKPFELCFESIFFLFCVLVSVIGFGLGVCFRTSFCARRIVSASPFAAHICACSSLIFFSKSSPPSPAVTFCAFAVVVVLEEAVPARSLASSVSNAIRLSLSFFNNSSACTFPYL